MIRYLMLYSLLLAQSALAVLMMRFRAYWERATSGLMYRDSSNKRFMMLVYYSIVTRFYHQHNITFKFNYSISCRLMIFAFNSRIHTERKTMCNFIWKKNFSSVVLLGLYST